MEAKGSLVLMGMLVAVMGLATAMQLRTHEYAHRLPDGVTLRGLMEQTFKPWQTREIPIGASEFIIDKTEQVLNFTETWHAEVYGPTATFDVFVSYWAPDTYEERLVGGHTPDACWPANGWKVIEAESETQPFPPTVTRMGPWEFRTFAMPGSRDSRNVIFTHIADGSLTVYPMRRKHFLDSLRIGFIHGLRSRPEQVFLRVSWDGRQTAPYRDPAMLAFLAAIERIFWNPATNR